MYENNTTETMYAFAIFIQLHEKEKKTRHKTKTKYFAGL